MVKGKIWGTVCGEYDEIEIDECDVIVAIGLKVPDEEGMIDTQAAALGYGLTIGDFVTSVARDAVRLALDQGDSPEEKRTVLALLMKEIANNALAEIGNRTLFRREASGEVGER